MTSLIRKNDIFNAPIFQSSMLDLFDQVFGDDFYKPIRQTSLPAVKLNEDKEKYSIAIAAQGLKKEDFDITIRENLISIDFQKTEKTSEYSFCQSFAKSWKIPKNVDLKTISADYEQGVLQLTLPKLSNVESPEMKIQVG
jgi:HSP20 family protein